MSPTPTRALPVRPCLDQFRRQARELQRAARGGDADAIERVRAAHPRAAEVLAAALRLGDAQLVLAREYGFASWPSLRARLDSLAGLRAVPYRVHRPDLDYYNDRAEGIRVLHEQGLPEVLQRIAEVHPDYSGWDERRLAGARFTIEDARTVVARMHGCEDWGEFAVLVSGDAGADGFRSAYAAVEGGDAAALAEWLRREPGLVQARGSNGHTLLHFAASSSRLECVRVLLAAGADPDAPSDRGLTPLHQAGYGGNAELADLLLAVGASPAVAAYGSGGTPLVMALFWGHVAAAERLAAAAVVPMNLRVAAGLGRLDLIERCFDRAGRLLPAAGADRGFYRPHRGFHPSQLTGSSQEILDEALTYAARNGRLEAMAVLRDRGADVDAEPYNGTSLHWAIASCRQDAAAWLLDHGAEVNRVSRFGGVNGTTPLHIACAWGSNPEGARLLLRRGADPSLRDPEHHSPPWGWANIFGHAELRDLVRDRAAESDLFAAVHTGSFDRVRELLDRDSGAIHRDDAWTTPLILAISQEATEIVRLLVERGADPGAAERESGRSALDVAREKGRADIVELMSARWREYE